jgi:hypothetical protein
MSMTTGDLASATEDRIPNTPLIKRSWHVARKIARDPAGVASVIALLSGVVASLLPLHGYTSIAVHSVGYAVVGGAAFSLIYQFWANEALLEAISRRINVGSERSLQAMKQVWDETAARDSSSFSHYTNDMAQMHKRHWPLDVYPEGNEPNRSFNERVEADLQNAYRYDFRGQSGRHLASRLVQGRYPRLQAVRIIIEDATVQDVMDARISEKRFGAADGLRHLSNDQLRAVVLNDLFESLVGLHVARSQVSESIQLVYATRPTDVRIEVIDNIVYLSPFIRNRPRGNKYPEVFRYDPHSVPGEIAALEFNREFSMLSSQRFELTRATSRQSLLDHLLSKGFTLTAQQFAQRYSAAERSLRSLGSALGADSLTNE